MIKLLVLVRKRKLYLAGTGETDPWHLLEEFNNSNFYP